MPEHPHFVHGLIPFLAALSLPAAAQFRSVAPMPLAPSVMVAPRVALPAPALAAPRLALPAPTLTPTLAAPRAAAANAVSVPAVGEGAPVPSRPATKAELDFASYASVELALLADDMAAENGLKVSMMKGADFLAVVEAAAARWKEEAGEKAPSPEALSAGIAVQRGMMRVARALLTPDAPLTTQIRRLLSVWQVFNQEMAAAAEKGTLSAVSDDAALFASQVEQSI